MNEFFVSTRAVFEDVKKFISIRQKTQALAAETLQDISINNTLINKTDKLYNRNNLTTNLVDLKAPILTIRKEAGRLILKTEMKLTE